MEPNTISAGENQRSETSLTVFSDERYLMAYDLPEKQARGFRLWEWKKILAACALGVGLGLGGAAFRLMNVSPAHEIVKSQPESKAQPLSAIAPSAPRPAEKSLDAVAKGSEPVPAFSREEAARLKARNRRLEALISVLRQRANAPDRKPAQEQAAYLGQ